MSKTGAEYIESLRDGRSVFIDGELITNHVDHPAFKNAVMEVAALYDFQAENPELMTFTSPTSGKQVNRSWQIPRTQEDLIARANAHKAWARQSGGWLGRSPDHVPAALVGMMCGIEIFERHNPERAKALREYFEWARDNDLSMTYAIVNPQGDRSKGAGDQSTKYHSLGVVSEDAEGITVRGAKMLATSATLAQEVLVGVQNPLKPDEDMYALSFAIPLSTPGVKTMSRRSYEESATSTFDYPLSTRFDENDALIYFDDVKIPWSRVFVYRSPDTCREMFHLTAAEPMMNLQSQARLTVKLQFLLGLARRITETTGTINFPPVQDTLGRLAAQVTAVESAFQGLVAMPVKRNEYLVPDAFRVYSATSVGQELYPDFIKELRNLVGGGVIMLPSSVEDFANKELAPLIEATQQSSAVSPIGRVQLMKLAWDAIGSEFGSRHTQYEMFYSGPPFVQRMRLFGSYDWDEATALVDSVLAATEMPKES